MDDKRGEPLRIVIACPNFHVGGWSTHTLTLAAELKRVGHYVIALVLDPFGELYETFQAEFDEVVVVRRGLERRDTFLRRILGVLVALRPNAVLGSGVPAVQAIHPYFDPSIVRITTIHSICENELREGTANATSTDWIVAVANNIASKLQTNTLTCQVALIPVGVPISEHRRPKTRSTILRLAYVGRLSKAVKSPGKLIAISEALYAAGVPFSLTIIGSGDEQTRLMRDFSRTTAAANVNFTGQLTPTEVRQRLLDIDVLLLVSTYESTPHAVLEAMEAGVVPVVSRIPGATEDIIEDSVSGFLCETNSVSQYLEVMKRLHDDRQLLDRASKAARAVVASRFGAFRMAQQYINLIERTLASNTRTQKKAEEAVHIICCPELRHSCYGFARQLRRRAGDLFRALVKGIRPCCLPTSVRESKFL
jgi:glycosyltransferase involved in cell wall biosynthesis